MSFDLVIFDCDGVLVDSEALSGQVWLEFLRDHGIERDMDHFNNHYVGSTDAMIMDKVRAESGQRLPADTPRQVEQRAIACFKEQLQAVPGILGAVQSVTGKKCVCTNSGKDRVHASLRAVGLLDLFGRDLVFHSGLVEQPKPSPQLHRLAARILEASPGNSLVIEDSVTGITAAKAAGMTAFGFTGTYHSQDEQADKLWAAGADLIFREMPELPGLLNRAA